LFTGVDVLHTGAVFHIGSVIRHLREQRKRTLIEFAGAAGISPTTLSRIERTGENFERATLLKIARELHVAESDLYSMQQEGDAAFREALLRELGGKEDALGSPGETEDYLEDAHTPHEGSQEMPDPDQVHGMITALRFAPPERRDEFVQYCISYAIGLRRKRATGTDPNG
jgi:transcriptional regulator with XRE-family HTH domain